MPNRQNGFLTTQERMAVSRAKVNSLLRDQLVPVVDFSWTEITTVQRLQVRNGEMSEWFMRLGLSTPKHDYNPLAMRGLGSLYGLRLEYGNQGDWGMDGSQYDMVSALADQVDEVAVDLSNAPLSLPFHVARPELAVPEGSVPSLAVA